MINSETVEYRPCLVYALSSTEDERIRYVGQTVSGLDVRVDQHVRSAKRGMSDSYSSRWIRKVLKSGHQIRSEVLEYDATLHESEIEWISFFRSVYDDLTNSESGGVAGGTMADWQKRKISKAHMGKKLSKEHNAKFQAGHKAHKITEETRRRISEAGMNRHVPESVKEKHRGEANGRSKLKEADVLLIKDMLKNGLSGSDIARKYHVTRNLISMIKLKKAWAHVH